MSGALLLLQPYDFMARTVSSYFQWWWDELCSSGGAVMDRDAMMLWSLHLRYYCKLYNFCRFLCLEICVEYLVIMQQNVIFSAVSAKEVLLL